MALFDGGFVMAWNSAGQDGLGGGVFASVFAADGQTVAAKFLVNQTTTGDQTLSDVVIGDDGRTLVTWTSNNELFVRLLSETGAPGTAELPIAAASDIDASVVALTGGGIIAS